MLTFGRDHCLPNKRLVFITACSAEDRYGDDLAIKMLESITGRADMGLNAYKLEHAFTRSGRAVSGTD
jgi:hypothetical protein